MKYRELLRDERGNHIGHFKGQNLYQDIKMHFEVREICDEAEKQHKEYMKYIKNLAKGSNHENI